MSSKSQYKGATAWTRAMKCFRRARKQPYPEWRTRVKNLGSILALLSIIFLSGCTTSEVLGHIDAHVSVDQNGNVIGSIGLKDARKQCLQCNDIAVAQIKSTSKAAIADINAQKNAELARLKIERKNCGAHIIVTTPSPVHVEPNLNVPQVGDVVVPAETNSDGSFSIPGEKGLFRVEPKCYTDADGRKICK